MRATSPREGRGWPGYLFGGRLRTSTAILLIAFCAIWWLYATYQPARTTPAQVPASEVVPPGFIPDPDYTWAPRTDVQRRAPATTTQSPTTTPTTPAVPASPTASSVEPANPADTGAPAESGGETASPTSTVAPAPSSPTASPTSSATAQRPAAQGPTKPVPAGEVTPTPALPPQ